VPDFGDGICDSYFNYKLGMGKETQSGNDSNVLGDYHRRSVLDDSRLTWILAKPMIDRKRIYHRILDLAIKTGHAHLPSSFTIVEILCKLYETKGPNDKIILSKGHGCYAQYAILQEIGVMPEDYLVKGHPDNSMPGIFCSTGSLGHGLAISVGVAIAKRIKKMRGTVYCICGDGETEEGSVWEAWNIAQALNLDNLVMICDNNEGRFRQFGVWGMMQLINNRKGYPSEMMMEDPGKWHHRMPISQELETLRSEINSLKL
jgi:deoxyxylulose-5-phosphate synthase